MKKILHILIFVTISYNATAQFTSIPDAGFELVLIMQNIDSDGVINGQVLTTDIENVTELIIEEGSDIEDLTGIQDFTALEKLVILYSGITELDVSQNLQLKILDCSSNNLTTLDVSSNVLLEELYIGNYGLDVAPFTMIEEIDLSQNPNIHTLNAYDSVLKKINLKNGNNNSDMSIIVSIFPWGMDEPDYDPYEIRKTVCIEVDDVEAAQNNLAPYSDWEITNGNHVAINFTDDVTACALNTPSYLENNITMYPNPTSDWVYFENLNLNTTINILDFTGKLVYSIQPTSEALQINTSGFSKEIYLVQLLSSEQTIVKKLVVN